MLNNFYDLIESVYLLFADWKKQGLAEKSLKICLLTLLIGGILWISWLYWANVIPMLTGNLFSSVILACLLIALYCLILLGLSFIYLPLITGISFIFSGIIWLGEKIYRKICP
ncbi:hypothetical protein CEP49_06135 [Mergibacter septicus]|uniref:hypothetical protein n=1 Tax=Mergibacter septicus TaxID=221402 RepID=UPI0011798794|nr:hypothetical protein [Mergibacter septicus]AWX13104.1 hypothetical protein CEP49_00355 [Mergibacter septicus]AWX13785.1 hypothetical protein CEP49_04055 [Mergibacter septicus]AWX14156.1 hypothetical protein CEP49_06135 [Mergibacter septicus]